MAELVKIAKPIQRADSKEPEALQQPPEEMTPDQTGWLNDGDVTTKAEQQLQRGRVSDEWSLMREGILPQEHPLFRVAASALGMSHGATVGMEREMVELIDSCVKLTGSTDSNIIFNFLSRQARLTPGKSLRAIRYRIRAFFE